MMDMKFSSRDLMFPNVSSGVVLHKIDPPPPRSITFYNGGCGTDDALFTIKEDGEIVRGPQFTTEDAMSLMFWEKIAEAFPQFLKLADSGAKPRDNTE